MTISKLKKLLAPSLLILLVVACAKDDKAGSAGVPVPPPPSVIDGQYGNYQGKYVYTGQLAISNHSLYVQYLKDHNVCEPPGTFTYTIGPNTWDCDNYSGIYVQINLDSLKYPTTGFAQIFSYYLQQHLVLQPSLFHGEFALIDQNTGIELLRRGYDGTPTYNAIIRYRVLGIPKNNSTAIPLEIYYRNGLLGRATIQRAN